MDIGVGARESTQASVRAGAEDVVGEVSFVRRELVVAEDVVARAVPEADSLRAPGMVALTAFAELLPTVRIGARVVHAGALDDDTREGAGLGVNRRVVVDSPAVLLDAAPATDVTALDDDVVRAWAEHDTVNPGRPERQAAEDDMGGIDLHAVIDLAGGVDRGRTGTRAMREENIPLGRA